MASIIRKLRNIKHGITDETDLLDISRISENLFVSNWPCAKHAPEIASYGIELIICTLRARQDKELNQPPLRLVQIPTIDSPLFPIPLSRLRQGVAEALPVMAVGGKVLVFCMSGIHRSVAMASCILIGQGYSADDAMRLVKEKRDIADPYAPHIRKRIEKFEIDWRNHHGETNSSRH